MLTRLAALGPARLARPGPSGAPPAQLVHPVLQHLADVAALAEGEPRREVPRLAPHALGDQLAVLGRDLLALAPPGGPLGAGELDDAADRLVALRRALP